MSESPEPDWKWNRVNQPGSNTALLERIADRMRELEALCRKLAGALRFYAGNFPDDDLGNWQERICEDEGDQARAALAEFDRAKDAAKATT